MGQAEVFPVAKLNKHLLKPEQIFWKQNRPKGDLSGREATVL